MATDSSQAAVDGQGAPAPVAGIQLTQVRVPLDDAAEALSTQDEAGRLPIVVLPKQAYRIRNGFVGAGILLVIGGLLFDVTLPLRGGSLAAGALLVILGVFRAFMVPVPEGSRAVLLRRGRFHKTLGPGNHIVVPNIVVSHIVTTRETPFDAPATEIPTRDDVRTSVDILMTFRIEAPEKFVFTISAADFDQVCQATCQEVVRLLLRDKLADEVLDLGEADSERMRSEIGAALEPYGVVVVRVVVTHVMPPLEFMASRESRRLASLQRAEEAERHTLELLRQADQEELEQQRIKARERAIELEAANEVARLTRLEERLRAYPNAVHWDVESQRLDVARSLAANTRAMVQVGSGSDVAASLLMHTLPEDGTPAMPDSAGDSSAAAPGREGKPDDPTIRHTRRASGSS
jgi:regulator of protease activity HflC (stomatin/prohibitin superfamily)